MAPSLGTTEATVTHVERLSRSEAILRAVVESPRSIVIFALDREYRYIAYNENHARTMRQIWGVQVSVGTNMLELIGREDDRTRAQLNFDRALAGESFTVIEEYGNTEMERRFYEDVYSPVRDEEGTIIGLTVYLTDITAQRKAQVELDRYRGHLEELVAQRTQELKVMHAQLLHSQKLESLGVLAGGIAHDFNNLLAVIVAHAELGIRTEPTDGPRLEHMSTIRETALEARMLTKQLLSYAGKGKFVVLPLDLNKVLKDMEPLLHASIGKGIRLQIEMGDEPIVTRGDATQLHQVILNLATNAAEAIAPGTGSIRIRAGVLDATAAVLQKACFTSNLLGQRCVFLEVTDDGCGISVENRDKLFDPFFTTKFTGRGLGLAAVLGIVRGHNGTILLSSKPMQGSCFQVLLPAADASELATTDSRPNSGRPPYTGGRVLVVDDEQAVRDATIQMLQSIGYRSFQAHGGKAACELLRRYDGEIDVVLLDLAMPDMDGVQTLRELKRIRPDIAVILLTAYAEDEFRSRFEPNDLTGFISKPFTREELMVAVNRAMPNRRDDHCTHSALLEPPGAGQGR